MNWEEKTLPDLVRPGLAILFVGINPGKRSAEIGHHFGGYTNHFWRLLHDAGLTPRLYRAEEDRLLLDLGYGLTNLAPRATRSGADLARAEMAAGGSLLREKISRWRPRIACFLGKDPYRYYAGTGGAPLAWGVQEPPQVEGVIDFLAPNPSSRSTVPYHERLRIFRELKAVAGL